jgi:hypothetical protein
MVVSLVLPDKRLWVAGDARCETVNTCPQNKWQNFTKAVPERDESSQFGRELM